MRPLLDNAVDVLRQALNAKLQVFEQTWQQQQAQLHADADWKKLTDAQRAALGAQHNLAAPGTPPLGTPEQLQDTSFSPLPLLTIYP